MQNHTETDLNRQKPEKSTLLLYWESAVSARIARLQAIPEPLKESEPDVFGSNKFSLLAALKDEVDAGVTSVTDMMNAVMPRMNKASQVEREANAIGERLVLDRLRNGQMHAFAFEKPRSIKDDPVELDWQMIAGCEYFNWDNGALRKDSMNFVEVRFLSATEREWVHYINGLSGDNQKSVDASTVQAHDFADSKPVGRPGVSKHINDALLALHERGEIDFQKSMKSHYPLIRRWLAQNHPDMHVTDNTPGVEVMRRVVSPFFKTHKL